MPTESPLCEASNSSAILQHLLKLAFVQHCPKRWLVSSGNADMCRPDVKGTLK